MKEIFEKCECQICGSAHKVIWVDPYGIMICKNCL